MTRTPFISVILDVLDCRRRLCQEHFFGYSNMKKALQKILDPDEKKKTKKKQPLLGLGPSAGFSYHDHLAAQHEQGKAVYISESGLYSLIFKSKLPAAKSFKTPLVARASGSRQNCQS